MKTRNEKTFYCNNKLFLKIKTKNEKQAFYESEELKRKPFMETKNEEKSPFIKTRNE